MSVGGGGGGGGAPEGAGLEVGRGGGGAEGRCKFVVLAAVIPEGFLAVGGGKGGFFPIGGGGLGLGAVEKSEVEFVWALEGRRLFLSAVTEGIAGAAEGGSGGGAAPGLGGGPPLGLGGGVLGVAAFLEVAVSGSESYMFTPPPLLFNLGIPPANNPPSCGAASIPLPPPAAGAGESLLLLARFALLDPPGGLSPPGIGGAPATGAEPESFPRSMMGAERSLICATFFNRAPAWMSPSKAP